MGAARDLSGAARHAAQPAGQAGGTAHRPDDPAEMTSSIARDAEAVDGEHPERASAVREADLADAPPAGEDVAAPPARTRPAPAPGMPDSATDGLPERGMDPGAVLRALAEQYHRYALLLEHSEIEFIERVPAREVLWWKWGNKWEPRSRVRTCLGFSRRATDVAAAIRSELARKDVGLGPPIEMPQPTRAERTAGNTAVLHAKPK